MTLASDDKEAEVLGEDEEVPRDINAFFVHPLNSCLQNEDGATALLHEYRSLPAIDKTCDENSNDVECIEAEQVKELSEDDCCVLSLDGDVKSQLMCADESADSISAQTNSTSSDFMGETLSMDDNTLGELLFSESQDSNEELLREYLASPSPSLTDDKHELDVLIADYQDDQLPLPDSATDYDVSYKLVDASKPDAEMLAPKSEPESPPAQAPPQSTLVTTLPQATVHQPYQFHETIPPNPSQYMHPHGHPMINHAAPSMPYTMTPQFLHPMVVKTSTGHLHLQPFISHDGQIGITPVTPYHSPMPALPPVPMGMPWNPPCYPGAILGPEAMHMTGPPTVYLPHDDMMRQYVPLAAGGVQHPVGAVPSITQTQYGRSGTAVHSIQHTTTTDMVQPKTEAVSCIKTASAHLQQTTNNTSKELDEKTTESDCSNMGALQKACALSNIPSIPSSKSDQHTLPVSSASHFLKSPDSGFGEGHTDAISSECEVSMSNPGSPTTGVQRLKRRRSSMCSHPRHSKHANADTAINFLKRENDDTGYEIRMDVATSCGAKLDEDRMTYFNKGQLYTLTMQNTLPLSRRSTFVKSVITLRFRDESSIEGASKNWYYWCTRQTESNPKAIELDMKDSEGIVESSLKYNGVNSLTFSWHSQECVKAQLAVHCLSTDFSSQKGVKGLPLHIQIDTYDDINVSTNQPVHRAYAQIKIFCDKGAERKARDEEKRKDKSVKPDNPGGKQTEQYHSIVETTHFYSMSDLFTDVFIYKLPSLHTDTFDLPFRDLMASGDSLLLADNIVPSIMDNDILFPSNHKRLKLSEPNQVFLYVREVDDSAFTALLLETPTILGLCSAIQEKYTFVTHINVLLKRTSKGMLVRFDDKLVKHLMHESSYVIEFKKLSTRDYDVILTETDE